MRFVALSFFITLLPFSLMGFLMLSKLVFAAQSALAAAALGTIVAVAQFFGNTFRNSSKTPISRAGSAAGYAAGLLVGAYVGVWFCALLVAGTVVGVTVWIASSMSL
jgi:hypothetical protein